MIFIKTTPTKLLLAFALILDKNKKRFDYRAVALAYEKLNSYLFAKILAVLPKYEFSQLLDFFYERSGDKRIKKMPKKKFFRRYFRYLIKKGVLEISDVTSSIKEGEIAIFILNNEILIINEVEAFNELKKFIKS